jgi:outer membrane protein TolC
MTPPNRFRTVLVVLLIGMTSAHAQAPDAPLVVLGAPVATELVVDLEAVLRLTEQNNLQIARARQRLKESLLAYQAASQSWVPNCLRPETRQCITTEANVWRQRVELSQVTHDTLQEAGFTYIDWLTATQQESVARQLEGCLRPLLARTKELQKAEPGVRHTVESIQAAICAQQQSAVALEEQAATAREKLAYLLGVGHVSVVPRSPAPVPLDLVDITQPVDTLAAWAASAGPTVRELETLSAILQKGIDQPRILQWAAHCKGPQSSPSLHIQIVSSKRDEVGLTLEDTRQRLTLGAREAYQLIGSTRVQASLAANETHHAEEAYRLSNLRLRDLGPDRADLLTVEVMQSIQALGAAKSHRIASMNAHDKAQLRLLLLLRHVQNDLDPLNTEPGH